MARAAKVTKIGTEVKAPIPAGKTAVRNSAIPKSNGPVSGRKEVTHEMVARRAYEISISGSGGSEIDNWLRAERELSGQ